MNHYILSRQTRKDIDAIYDYGSLKFRKDQALNYLIGLRSYFQLLVTNPVIGMQRNEIKRGLYSFPYSSHIIFIEFLRYIFVLFVYFTEVGIYRIFLK